MSSDNGCQWYQADAPFTALFRYVTRGNICPIRFLAPMGKSLLKTKAHPPREYWGAFLIPIEFELLNQVSLEAEHYSTELPAYPLLYVFD